VTLLKSTVQLFIPVGALLMVIQLPVMVCNCMARQSRISLNRNRHVVWDDELELAWALALELQADSHMGTGGDDSTARP